MSINTNGTDNNNATIIVDQPAMGNWADNKQQGNYQMNKNTEATGLAGLFTQSSMSANSRHMKEVMDVSEAVSNFYKSMKNSTTSSIQQQTIPEVENMTTAISPQLPGLCMHRVISGTIYVMGVLFSNANMAMGSEFINIQGMNGFGNTTLSFMGTPTDAANKEMADRIRKHYTDTLTARGANKVELVNMVVVDLEMYKHSKVGSQEDRTRAIASWLTSEWEEAVLVTAAEEMTIHGIAIPSPFLEGKAYGSTATAEARVTALTDNVGEGEMLVSSNMEVRVNTVAASGQYTNNFNSKEVARVKATVSLAGWGYHEHMLSMQGQPMQQQGMPGIYPNNYHPLRPVITLDSVVAGEQLNNNGGLYPFFFGLFALVSSNNNYAFAEALRRTSVGARGNLSAMENTVKQLLQAAALPANGRVELDEKKMGDIEIVNHWIRQNVGHGAVYQVNLLSRSAHSSVNNFLMKLAGNEKDRAKYVSVMVNLIDSMSGGAMSEYVKSNKGWNMSLPVLHRTPTLVVNGLAKLGDKELNTLEIDEMLLQSVRGKNNQSAIYEFMRAKFGDVNAPQDQKVRSQSLRVQVSESLFDNAVHINQFANTAIWDPRFMQALGEVMNKIGTLHVSNGMNSVRANNMVYQQGIDMATSVSIGAGGMGQGGMGMSYMGSTFG